MRLKQHWWYRFSRPRSDSVYQSVQIKKSDWPNKHQYDVIRSDAERILVQAGAGSGKTHLFVQRIVNLIHAGVALSDIRVVTFTSAATKEVIERLSQLTEFSPDILSKSVSTIHKFAINILQELAPNKTFSIYQRIPNHPVYQAWALALKEELSKHPEELLEAFTIINSPYSTEAHYLKQKYLEQCRFQTRGGEMVRSRWEQTFADYLFDAGIAYEYEKPVLFADFIFCPDFYLPKIDAYIELLGLWDHPKLMEDYRVSFESKREQMKKWQYGYAYLEIYPDDMRSGSYRQKIDQFIIRIQNLSNRRLYRHQGKINAMLKKVENVAAHRLYELDQSLLLNQMSISKWAKHLPFPYRNVVPSFVRVRIRALEKLDEDNLVCDGYLFSVCHSLLDNSAMVKPAYLFIDEFQDVQPLQMQFLAHFMRKKIFRNR